MKNKLNLQDDLQELSEEDLAQVNGGLLPNKRRRIIDDEEEDD